MADIFEGNLTLADDWGNVIRDDHPEGIPASGSSVQEFIKGYLRETEQKPSAFHALDDVTNNQNIIIAFRSDADKESWLNEWQAEGKDIFSNEALTDSRVLTNVKLQKAKPEPYYQITLENHTETGNTYVSTDGKVILSLKFISKYFSPNNEGNMIATIIKEDGEIFFERRKDSSDSWAPLTRNVPISTIESVDPDAAPLNIDLSAALTDGYQEVRVMVESKTSNLSTPWTQFNITKTQLQLELATDWAIPQSTGVLKLEYYMTGEIDKNLNIRILDDDEDRIIVEHVGTEVYPKLNSRTYSVADIRDANSDRVKIITHGVRTIEAWLSMVGNDKITSEKVISQVMIVTDPEDETPHIVLNGLTLQTNEDGTESLTTKLTNWTNQSIFKYSLYHPTRDKIPFTMELRDYNAEAGDNYLYAEWPEILTNQQTEYKNTIEIESNDSLVYAELKLSSDGTLLTSPIAITIDNTGGYSPTAGADFIINPRLRSNDDAEPATIINTVTKEVVHSDWRGFNFSRDGWTVDDKGNRCLRILSGQELEIDYFPFVGWKDKDNQNNSCTIEFNFATRNISDDTIPIIRMCRYNEDSTRYNGWEQKALEGVYMTENKYDKIKQDVWFTEGVMAHVAINIVHNFINKQNFCRIFVNGRINREFTYNESTLADEGENALAANARKIIFGNVLPGCDLDIYGLRVYKKKLVSSDILQDYISGLPTVEEKQAEKIANNIITNGVIDYNLASRYYNTLLWKYNDVTTETRMVGLAESVTLDASGKPVNGDTKDTKMKGDLVIRVFELDSNGNQVIDQNTGLPVLDKKRSGTINNMTVKGQGTSSMYYWKWNQRWEFKEYDETDYEDGYRNSVFTPLELSENYTLTESYSWEEEDGETVLVNNSTWTNKETGETIKDDRKAAWQPEPGQPYAKRLDGKINFASPMQSHKLGSVGLYNDLWKDVVKDNEITSVGATSNGIKFTGTTDGYKSCRVSVIQRPFLVFCQKKADAPIEFYGLYTMGPSKGDKPTFGYNKKDFPNFVMMEGCDNGAKLVRCLVPWNDKDITTKELDDDGDKVFEIFYIGTDEQWEISMGSTKVEQVCSVTEVEEDGTKKTVYGPVGSGSNPVFKHFRDMCNFCYQLNPKIKCWDKGDGSYESLRKASNKELTDSSGNLITPDVNYVYWTIKGTAIPSNKNLVEGVHYIYNTYRYDVNSSKWVQCGVEYDSTGEDYVPLNISVQTNWIPTTGSRENHNQTFINKRVQMFKSGIKEYVDEKDMRYSMQFLKLIAASDNWSKNTYLYNTGITDENGNLTSKWRFFQDDLDTILSLDNSGYKVKPYYVEEHDSYVNDKGETVGYWNASDNAMYCLAEMAWQTEMRDMMKSILTAMASRGGSVEGCFDKYYGGVTKYLPAIAYNEITRLLYEDAEVARANGLYTYGNTVDPLAQAVGDQLQAETQWLRQRSVYLSSYANYGIFASGGETSAGALSFRAGGGSGTSTEMRFTFTPSMWLYPSIANGSSSVNGVAGVIGETPNFNFNPTDIAVPPRVAPKQPIYFKTTATADQTVTIRGIDYYSNIGDFGKISASSKYGFPLSGNKLEQFKITDDNGSIILLPSSLSTPKQGMDNIKRIEIRGEVEGGVSIIGGQLDISGLWRLNYVDLTATSITSLVLPNQSSIVSLKLPATLTQLALENQPMLENLSLNGISKITSFKLSNCPGLKNYDMFKMIYDAKIKLQECYIDNIDWKDITLDELKYLKNIYNCTLKGAIKIKEGETLDFDLKAELLNKFGNIDNQDNDLYIDYEKKQINVNNSRINGETYVYKDSTYKYNIIANGNDFVGYSWGISTNDYAKMSKDGILTYKDKTGGGTRSAVITCSIDTMVNIEGEPTIIQIPITKTIYFNEKVAEVGDIVYSDGSISSYSDRNPNKKIVGICFYVNGSDRRMVALDDIASQVQWGLTETLYNNDKTDSVTPDIAIDNITSLGSYNGSDLFGYRYHLSNLENLTSSNTLSGSFGTKALSANKVTPITDYGITSEYNMGDVVPMGLYNTLEIIDQRNKVMTKFMAAPSSSYPSAIPGVVYKKDAEGNTIKVYDETIEMQDLEAKLAITQDDAPYYPAASYCYAYEPDFDDLDEKFKRHNWYLPSYGELARVFYLEHTDPQFSLLINQSLYNKLSACTWTSSEYNSNSAWVIIPMYNSSYGDYLAVEAHTKNITKGYQVNNSYLTHAGHGGFLVRPAARF